MAVAAWEIWKRPHWLTALACDSSLLDSIGGQLCLEPDLLLAVPDRRCPDRHCLAVVVDSIGIGSLLPAEHGCRMDVRAVPGPGELRGALKL